MLQSIGSQRVRHDWVTELTECISLTNGAQHNIISWMLPSKTSWPMEYLQDSGYGKDFIQFFDKLQIYCRDTVIRVFKISKAFLFRDLNLICLCFPELCYTAFLCISGNLLSVQAFSLLSIKWLSFSSWTKCMEQSLLKIKILGIIPEIRAISKILSSSLTNAQ